MATDETPGAAPQAPRAMRRDVRRNLDALLAAAAEVFRVEGVDAPVRHITERAGVGVGTLYRHFPLRSDLIVAVFRHEVDALMAAAAPLSAAHPPVEALVRWLERLAGFVATKRGLSGALHSGDPAYEGLREYFESRFVPVIEGLMDAAAATGEIRAGLSPFDLLVTLANVVDPDDPAYTGRVVGLLMDGLRYRAG
ncbi:TetR/AcrR family transcriptional regulator [Streptomyces sp. GZWMJZ-114]|uniref:TetR/AcrR family transcriptional regulator n=1 Tax=Streptomyces sp. GZWMJZ-114 TaxID=2494734 RepID=UPI001010AE53|nr:TetR/AcrR family transcriptional regulator [Streptomyces sp. GZWMJZ-114]